MKCDICKKTITPKDYIIPYGISLCYCDWKNICKKCYEKLTERKNLAKLQLLCDKITNQSRELLKSRDLDCETNLLNAKAIYKIKKKYTYIDIGKSGKYLINDNGEIYGIKAYGVINKGHFYGTLDNIEDYYWGDYTAKKITKESL